MKSLLSFILSLSLVTQAYATSIVVSGNVNGRANAKNFRTQENIVAVIPKDSEGEVLETKKLPSQNSAVKIRITKVGQAIHTRLKVGDIVWVYYHQDPERRLVELYDGKKIAKPETAKKSKALKSFKIANKADPAQKKKTVDECVTGAAVDKKVQNSFAGQLECLEKFTAEAAQSVNVTQEEIAAFIRDRTKRDGYTSNDNPDHHRRIAAALVKYAKTEDKIARDLAVMAGESGFRPAVTSKKAAGGLMQLTRETAHDEASNQAERNNYYKIETNVKLGDKRLDYLIDKYGLEHGLVAYNAGEGNLKKYLKQGHIPSSVRQYAKDVIDRYRVYQSVIANTGLVLNDPFD